MTPSTQATALTVHPDQLAELLFAASQDVFTSMLGCEIQRSSEPLSEHMPCFDGVLAMIGLAGPIIGNGALLCSADSARDMSARLLLCEFPSVDEQVLDAVGEIANMIIGGFKNLLEETTGPLQMSIPSVVYGKNLAARNCHAAIRGGVNCTFGGGPLQLRVRLAPAPDIQSEHYKRYKQGPEIRYY